MNITLRNAAAALKDRFPGSNTRLYIGNRKGEMIYAVSELMPDQIHYSPDILYVCDWDCMLRLLPDELPPNLLCTEADQAVPTLPRRNNLLMTDATLTVAEISEYLAEASATLQSFTHFSGRILDMLDAPTLTIACEMAARMLGNPILVLGVDFLPSAYCLMDTDNSVIVSVSKTNDSVLKFIKNIRDELGGARTLKNAVMLNIRSYDIRIITASIMQNDIDIGKIVLFEDRVKFDEAADRDFVDRFAKILQVLIQRDSPISGQRLTKEYALVNCLGAGSDDMPVQPRLESAGYELQEHFYVMTVDSALLVTYDLSRHLKSLHMRINSIVSTHGITTIYKDQVVSLMNLNTPQMPESILHGLDILLENNRELRIGISQHFTDANQITRYYRQSLDAIGVGRMMRPTQFVTYFDDIRVYMMLSRCARFSNPLAYLHPALHELIRYDRKYGTDYMRVLYLYLFMLKKTKETADKLHIHRNTLLYRLDKIQGITNIDFDDSQTILELMLSFRILEYDARNKNQSVCFLPDDTTD